VLNPEKVQLSAMSVFLDEVCGCNLGLLALLAGASGSYMVIFATLLLLRMLALKYRSCWQHSEDGGGLPSSSNVEALSINAINSTNSQVVQVE
jgi:hypothetical protein